MKTKTITLAVLAGWLGACGAAPDAAVTSQPALSAAAGSGAPVAPAQPSSSATQPLAAATGPVAAPAANPATRAAMSSGGVLPCAVSKALATSCQSCHAATPIGGAPMALVSYADLLKPATTQPDKKVYELVRARIHDSKRPMPPNGTLSPADLAAIDGWAMAGAQSAPASEATCAGPAPAEVGEVNKDFSTGRLSAGPGETCYDFKVHGSKMAVDDSKLAVGDGEFYEQFYYKVPWPAGTAGTAYATVADNAQVLHHWLLFSTNELQAEGNHITAPLPTLIGSDPVLLAGWAVGGPNVVAPPDVGFELPDPGRTINVQWHFYNSTGKPQTDGSSLQICTVPKGMRKNIANATWTGTEDLNGNKWFGGAGMPPHQQSTFTTTCTPGRQGMTADQSIHILGFEPHMHRIGKRMQTAVKHLDGSMETIFDKPFTFGSETHYPASYDLKPGEQLVTSCSFDNDNDFGVPFGESTDTEMCYQFVWAYPAHAVKNGAPSLLGVPDTCW